MLLAVPEEVIFRRWRLLAELEEEKMDGPNAFESPPVGRVREPDLRRLLRSVKAEEATDEATEAE